MGKPISSVGGATSAPVQQPSQSPEPSPKQSPTQSPVQSEPRKLWPPAYGWRLSALEGGRESHNRWQATWLEHGSAIAGGGPIDSVAQLKPKLRPHLQQGAHRA